MSAATESGEPSPQPSPSGEGVKPPMEAIQWPRQPSRGRGTGLATPQAQRPPRGAGSHTKWATVGANFVIG